MKNALSQLQRTYLQLQIKSRKDVMFAVKTDSIRAELRNTIATLTGRTDQDVQEECELEAFKYTE